MKPLIAPSILAADFARLESEVASVMQAGADLIHFDVMDNHYVPNLTVGPVVLESLRRHFPDLPVDVHLMVEPVDALIDEFLRLNPAYVSIHPEATRHPHASLDRIRAGGAMAGVVLNPGTPVSALGALIDCIDLVLVMSVNPGFGGQKFIESSMEKVAEVRRLLDQQGRGIRLQVDGGINSQTIGGVRRAGADMFVAGSAIFGAQDYAQAIADLHSAMS